MSKSGIDPMRIDGAWARADNLARAGGTRRRV